jgi:hypothetical protein
MNGVYAVRSCLPLTQIAKFSFPCYYLNMTTQTIKRKIVPILKRQGVVKAALFGSIVRGEAGKNSDIDILVNLKKDKTLLDLIGLKLELEEKLNRKVDVLTYNGINPRLKDNILNEQKIIYEKRS